MYPSNHLVEVRVKEGSICGIQVHQDLQITDPQQYLHPTKYYISNLCRLQHTFAVIINSEVGKGRRALEWKNGQGRAKKGCIENSLHNAVSSVALHNPLMFHTCTPLTPDVSIPLAKCLLSTMLSSLLLVYRKGTGKRMAVKFSRKKKAPITKSSKELCLQQSCLYP